MSVFHPSWFNFTWCEVRSNFPSFENTLLYYNNIMGVSVCGFVQMCVNDGGDQKQGADRSSGARVLSHTAEVLGAKLGSSSVSVPALHC